MRGVKLLLVLCMVTPPIIGCSSITAKPAEFTLRDVPSNSEASNQEMDIYEIDGHGKSCYVAQFGVASLLLWCEDRGK